MKGVSIVIPAYNEESGIGSVIDTIHTEMRAIGCEYEVLVVNDGSTDNTANAVKQNEYVRIISHSENQGYGAALKTGINNARFDNILITDADGTYPVTAFRDLIKNADSFDMVVGARVGKNVKIPWVRRPAKYILNKLANYLVEQKIPDLNSGLRLFKKDLVKKFFPLLPSGFSFTTTVTLAMMTNGYSVKYFPIDYLKREGKSKIKPIKDTIGFTILIIRTVLCFNPLKVFIPLFLILFFLGLGKFVWDAIWYKDIGEVSIIILLAALQIAVVGMLADLIDRRIGKI